MTATPPPVSERIITPVCRSGALVFVLLSAGYVAIDEIFRIAGFGGYFIILGFGFLFACAGLKRREGPVWATRLVVAGYLVWMGSHFVL